jgi:dTDP-4-amino-4,6-dideoxygalactose transaminase
VAGIVPFVALVAQYESIAEEIDRAFHEVTASAQYILGARMQRFEEEFANFVGADHAVGVGSCLDALRLGPELTEEQIRSVTEATREFFASH